MHVQKCPTIFSLFDALILVFNSNAKVQLSVTQTQRYRLSKFGQNEWDFDGDPFKPISIFCGCLFVCLFV